jgi:hypothetical protein
VTEFESYVPVLLNFRDNRLIYSSEHLAHLEEHVLNESNGITKAGPGCEFAFELTADCIRDAMAATGVDKKIAKCEPRVEVYYYHHRVILKYVFKDLTAALASSGDTVAHAPSDPRAELERRVRQFVLAHSRHVLVEKFVHRINSAAGGRPLPDESGLVTAYYSYCILYATVPASFERNVKNLLGSHTFRIVEITPKLLERDRVHIVRISIPSTNVYSTRPVDHFLRVDILNAIYQHLLYAKKDKDKRKLRHLTSFSAEDLDKRNVMEESQLHALWDHTVDALGGRMVDLQGVHQQTLNFRLSILAMLVALTGIILTVVLALQ